VSAATIDRRPVQFAMLAAHHRVSAAIVSIVAGLCWIAPAQAQSSVLDSPRIRLSAHVAQIMHDVAGF